jgi:hypothetical protein
MVISVQTVGGLHKRTASCPRKIEKSHSGGSSLFHIVPVFQKALFCVAIGIGFLVKFKQKI